MSFKIEYTDRDTGQQKTHTYSGNRHGADGWLDQLKSENGGKATLVETGWNQPDRHIATKGDARDKPTRPKPGEGW